MWGIFNFNSILVMGLQLCYKQSQKNSYQITFLLESPSCKTKTINSSDEIVWPPLLIQNWKSDPFWFSKSKFKYQEVCPMNFVIKSNDPNEHTEMMKA
jgi:hypothetical protein